MRRLPPGRLAGAARHRRARHPPDDARDRRAVRVPRHHATSRPTGFAQRFPHDLRQVPRGRASTSRRSRSRWCRRRTTAAAASPWTTWGGRACAGCARSARCRAPGCTARTGWRARRCSSAWSGARAPGSRRRARHCAADADYYLPEIAPWQYETEPVDPALVAQDWLTIRQTMWNYVGLVRNRRRLDRAHEILRELHLEIGRFYARVGAERRADQPAQRRADGARGAAGGDRVAREPRLPLPDGLNCATIDRHTA